MSLRMILFDLDGTLVQTREASWRVFEKVNRRFDLGVNSAEAFYALSEGNLFAGLREKCGDDARAKDVRGNVVIKRCRIDLAGAFMAVLRVLNPRLVSHVEQ